MCHPPTFGLILAGGLARRMGGGDKGLVSIGGATIIDRIIKRLEPACSGLLMSANGDPARFVRFAAPVIADSVPGLAGPLAGILAGLDWAAAEAPEIAWIVSAPADCPFLPFDLVPQLHAARTREEAPLAIAASGERRHPAVGLWPVRLREDLRRTLVDEGLRKVEAWATRHGGAVAEWPNVPIDPFFNVNTSADLAEAERLCRLLPA